MLYCGIATCKSATHATQDVVIAGL